MPKWLTNAPARAYKLGLGIFLLGCSAVVSASNLINMDVGELKIINPGPIERVAVGDAKLVSTSLLKNGQLLLFAEKEGYTEMHFWLSNGGELNYYIQIDPADLRTSRLSDALTTKAKEVFQLLEEVPGLKIQRVGGRIVLSGNYDKGYTSLLTSVKKAYSEVLDLTLSGKVGEVKMLVGDVPGIKVKEVGDKIVLTGEIDEGYADTLATIQGAFPEIMDLTRKSALLLRSEKNVLLDVSITEFSKNLTDQLGIQWLTDIPGPNATFALESQSKVARDVGLTTLLQTTNAAQTFGTSAATTAKRAFGFFGIATELTSRIQLAINTGNAVLLAQPRLVARSGGEAKFQAGGEVPIPVPSQDGTNIEFKPFGIMLDIKPVVDSRGHILANVSTEISLIDNTVQAAGVPGFKTRKTSTDVSMRSGETLVISGLVDRNADHSVTGLKGLSSIPILGALFRSKNFVDKKTELVIFVTPTVYSASSERNKKALVRQETLLQKFDEITGKSSKILD